MPRQKPLPTVARAQAAAQRSLAAVQREYNALSDKLRDKDAELVYWEHIVAAYQGQQLGLVLPNDDTHSGSDRSVPYEHDVACDRCGRPGASDYMGDMICPECASVPLPGPSTRPISKEEGMVAVKIVGIVLPSAMPLPVTETVATPDGNPLQRPGEKRDTVICHKPGCSHPNTFIRDGYQRVCSTELEKA